MGVTTTETSTTLEEKASYPTPSKLLARLKHFKLRGQNDDCLKY
jgi:hypothetical protein